MQIRSISIKRPGDYGQSTPPNEPMQASVEVTGDFSKMTVRISDEVTAKIVSLIARELATASAQAAQAFTEELFTAGVAALPAPASPVIEGEFTTDDELPF